MVVDHPSVSNVHQQDVFEGGVWKRQMVVETTLSLDASGPEYDADEVGKLQIAVVDYMRAYPASIDSVLVRTKAD